MPSSDEPAGAPEPPDCRSDPPGAPLDDRWSDENTLVRIRTAATVTAITTSTEPPSTHGQIGRRGEGDQPGGGVAVIVSPRL